MFIKDIMANSELWFTPRQGFHVFEDFERGKYIYEEELKILQDYIAEQLNSYWSPNREFYYRWYSQCGDLFRVIEWRKSHGFGKTGKYG